MPLAIDSYRGAGSLADEEGKLNLSWTVDEGECLAADLREVIASELAAEVRDALPYIGTYLVQDPYAGILFGPAVRAHFGAREWSVEVTCGAGVISLLHGAARLAAGRSACILGETYPDFPHWVEQCGGRLVALGPEQAEGGLEFALAGEDPAVVFLERPSLTEDRLAALPDVSRLCESVPSGALVVIDESNANYWPPSFSAVQLAGEVSNLLVVRGFSKAYGLGGLRLAYCVGSEAATRALRAVLPPLLPSSLSLRIGAAVLELGDVAAPLRRRIRTAKQELRGALEQLGMGTPQDASEHLPYVFLDGDLEAIKHRLASAGITGKEHWMWPGRDSATRSILRLSAPLAESRARTLRALASSGRLS